MIDDNKNYVSHPQEETDDNTSTRTETESNIAIETVLRRDSINIKTKNENKNKSKNYPQRSVIDNVVIVDNINMHLDSGLSHHSFSHENSQDPPFIPVELPERMKSEVCGMYKSMMNSALTDAGRCCHGVKAIEVWTYNAKKNSFSQAKFGTWVDHEYFMNNNLNIVSALKALYDPNSTASSCTIREGLPGALWAATGGKTISISGSKFVASIANAVAYSNKITWADVGVIEKNSHPPNPRLSLMTKAGFHCAAGVPFNTQGVRGIVIYMAHIKASKSMLTSEENEKYLLCSGLHIGSIMALHQMRVPLAQQRHAEMRQIFEKCRRLLRAVKCFSMSAVPRKKSILQKLTCTDAFKRKVFNAGDAIKLFFDRWAQKMHGGNVLPGPGSPWDVSIFVVIAAFITVFIMMAINEQIVHRFGSDLSFEHSQIASVTTMAYIVTASPAAQPHSIILGRSLSMLVGMCFSHIIPVGQFESYINWARAAGAVSVSTALMGKFGIAHPPGGSLALLFIKLKYKWDEIRSYQKIGILILQDCIFIIIASVFINTQPSAIYPTYWGYLPNMISSSMRKCFSIMRGTGNQKQMK